MKNLSKKRKWAWVLQRQVNKRVIQESDGSHEEGWKGWKLSYVGTCKGRVSFAISLSPEHRVGRFLIVSAFWDDRAQIKFSNAHSDDKIT